MPHVGHALRNSFQAIGTAPDRVSLLALAPGFEHRVGRKHRLSAKMADRRVTVRAVTASAELVADRGVDRQHD
ncbi:MAG: hypothetical protein M3082_20200 [Candidatus Dormibacteraeota bacterium]|nr:hypothetical protein [Candidatus Dormibacteraeota bacterium]